VCIDSFMDGEVKLSRAYGNAPPTHPKGERDGETNIARERIA
jgi:hypothetical protein